MLKPIPFSSRVGMSGTFADFSALESVLISAMHLRSAEAKRPGMHSNAKRLERGAEGMAEIETNPLYNLCLPKSRLPFYYSSFFLYPDVHESAIRHYGIEQAFDDQRGPSGRAFRLIASNQYLLLTGVRECKNLQA